MSRNVTKADQHGSGSLRSPKTALGCTLSILAICAGPDLSNRGLFFEAALPSPNVEKCDQSGSAWLRVPKVPQNCTWLHTFNFGDLQQVRTCRTEAFFSKLPCLARMSRNVTKADQHGSGSQGPPKLHLAAHFQFWRFRQVRTCRTEAFFSKLPCLARMSRNVTKAD